MNTRLIETADPTARQWRRWLWQTAQTGQPAPDLSFDDAVYEGSDLAGLMGDEAYASLVEWLASDPSAHEFPDMARRVLDKLFPHRCRCRRPAAMDRDNLNFAGPNVYRSLYFTDKSVTQSMRLLFRRTPELKLLECVECGDVWLQALDQVEWIQHLLLIQPEDIKRIETTGVWPVGLDKYEDAWVSEFAIIGRNSPQLREWQAAHNTPEAFARFGK